MQINAAHKWRAGAETKEEGRVWLSGGKEQRCKGGQAGQEEEVLPSEEGRLTGVGMDTSQRAAPEAKGSCRFPAGGWRLSHEVVTRLESDTITGPECRPEAGSTPTRRGRDSDLGHKVWSEGRVQSKTPAPVIRGLSAYRQIIWSQEQKEVVQTGRHLLKHRPDHEP